LVSAWRSSLWSLADPPKTKKRSSKVDRVLANQTLGSTASLLTSNIPFAWFLVLGCNRQAQNLKGSGGSSSHVSKHLSSPATFESSCRWVDRLQVLGLSPSPRLRGRERRRRKRPRMTVSNLSTASSSLQQTFTLLFQEGCWKGCSG